jgi:hypothetical protein
VEVPHWEDLSQTDEPWRVDLFEVVGSFISYRNWHWAEPGLRWTRPKGSTVFVSHLPARATTLRFACGVAASPAPPQGTVARFTVNRRRSYEWDGRGERFSVPVRPEDVREGRVRVDVTPTCAATAANPDGAVTPVGCVYLSGLRISAEPAASGR